MKLLIAIASFALAACVAQAGVSGSTSGKKESSKSVTSKTTSKKTVHHRRVSRRRRPRGQQKIDASRAREIQQALIEQHYLDGKASGKWDSQTQDALERYQSDNGWQTKVVPDSRALIKLGLGPDHDHLLNPETAMTSSLASGRSEPPDTDGDATTGSAGVPAHPQQ
jgi:hypothetical protein